MVQHDILHPPTFKELAHQEGEDCSAAGGAVRKQEIQAGRADTILNRFSCPDMPSMLKSSL